MIVAPEQLTFDFDAIVVSGTLADGLRYARRTTGAQRLLVVLVRAGIDESALPTAAAIAIELDRLPTSNGRGGAATPPRLKPSPRKEHRSCPTR